MGKHSAPVPPAKDKVHVIVRVATHHGVHCATLIALHVVALVVIGQATPVLEILGVTAH